ncbi:unnamed protein product [Prunus armeniaca]
MSFESNFTLFSNKDSSSVALSRAVVTEVRKEPSKLWEELSSVWRGEHVVWESAKREENKAGNMERNGIR